MALAPDGVLWFAGQNGAWSFDGARWHRYTKADGLADSLVLCVVADRTGAIWFGAPGGVSRFDGTSWRTFTRTEGLPNNRVNTMSIDRTGKLWIGTDHGVARWDGSVMTAFGKSDGLLAERIVGMTTDRTGRIWFCHGAGTKGVTVFESGKWKQFTPVNSEIPNQSAYTTACDSSGAVWFACTGSVASFDGASWKEYAPADGLKNSRVRKIFVDNANRKWFVYGSDDGLTCFDGSVWKTYTMAEGLISNTVYSMGQGKDGALYACTPGGISRLAGMPGSVFRIAGGCCRIPSMAWTPHRMAYAGSQPQMAFPGMTAPPGGR